MNRRTFVQGLALGAGATLLPPGLVSAKRRVHTNYYVHHFDRITRLVPYYAPRSSYTAAELDQIARRIIGMYPKPDTKLQRMLQLRQQVAAFWVTAFRTEPTPYQVAQTVHTLSHYKPPHVVLYRADGTAWAQDGASESAPPSPMQAFAFSLANQGMMNLTTALTIAAAMEAAGVAFEGVAITGEALAAIAVEMGLTAGALDIAALGLGFAAVGLTFAALAAVGIGLVALAIAMSNEDGSAGNVSSCTTCDCTSSAACGVGPGDDGGDGGDGGGD